MTTITADDGMLAVLNQAKGLSEIRDPRGNIIGLFAPVGDEQARQYAIASQFDWAEIERRKKLNEPGIPLRDTLDKLELLGQEIKRRKAAGEKDFTTAEALAFFNSLRSKTDRADQQPGPSVNS